MLGAEKGTHVHIHMHVHVSFQVVRQKHNYTYTHTNTHLGLAKTDETNLELPNARSDYSNRTESLRAMTETTSFWGILGWPFNQQVHSGGFVGQGLSLEPLPPCTLRISAMMHFFAKGLIHSPCSGVCTHTHMPWYSRALADELLLECIESGEGRHLLLDLAHGDVMQCEREKRV